MISRRREDRMERHVITVGIMTEAIAGAGGAECEIMSQGALLEKRVFLQEGFHEAQQLTADNVRWNMARIGDGQKEGRKMRDPSVAQSRAQRTRCRIARVADDERKFVNFDWSALRQGRLESRR